MGRRATVIGWKVPDDERRLLLQLFAPRYANIVADHVTLAVRSGHDVPLPPKPRSAKVVGHADDGLGVECLVVALDGTTDRPDGSSYHITWSLGPGRTARESNDVLRSEGWDALDSPVPIELTPARF